MRLNRTKTDPASCGHLTEMSVVSAGLTRTVCETCGNVRFQYEKGLSGRVERSMFARPADQHRPISQPSRQSVAVDLRVRYAVKAVA
jgi:hypothetical protein